MNEEREIVNYKECGSFNVSFNHVLFEDETYVWEVVIDWTDGAYPTKMEFDTYDEAFSEYNRWGY